MNVSIFDSLATKNVSKTDILKSIKFVVENRITLYQDNKSIVEMSNKVGFGSNSPLNALFEILKDRNFDMFGFISTINITDIPPLVLMRHINLDTKELSSKFSDIEYILKSVPSFYNKNIINVTQFRNKDQSKILDMIEFQKIIVRGACCRSFINSSNVWLNSSFIQEITKYYTLTISNNLARLYNLNAREMYSLVIVFAYYFINKVVDRDKNVLRNILSKNNELGSYSDIIEIVNLIDEIMNTDFNGSRFDDLNKLVKVLFEISPKRMSGLNLKGLLSVCRTFNYDNLVSLISLDYPPYWLYNLFATTAGEKSNLYFTLNKINLLKKAILFINNLIHDKSFLDSLF